MPADHPPKASKLLKEEIASIGGLDVPCMARAQRRFDSLTKPRGSLGRLEDLGCRLAGIKGKVIPDLHPRAVVVMAGDHGVEEEGVSAYPRAVTAQMLANFSSGGAAISVLCRSLRAHLLVVDMGVDVDLDPPGVLNERIGRGTGNITMGPAMSADEAVASMEAGMGVLAREALGGLELVATGDMGIGNTTPSSAIIAAMTGRPPREVTGSGTGIDKDGLLRKISAVTRALKVNRPVPKDPVDVLAKVGGFEIGGLVGVMLAAGARRIPVLLDGVITTAAALLACRLQPRLVDFLIASHVSAEPGHTVALQHIGLEPLFDLGMRLGEGSGAALAIPILDATVALMRDMATFEGAGVSGPVA